MRVVSFGLGGTVDLLLTALAQLMVVKERTGIRCGHGYSDKTSCLISSRIKMHHEIQKTIMGLQNMHGKSDFNVVRRNDLHLPTFQYGLQCGVMGGLFRKDPIS